MRTRRWGVGGGGVGSGKAGAAELHARSRWRRWKAATRSQLAAGGINSPPTGGTTVRHGGYA